MAKAQDQAVRRMSAEPAAVGSVRRSKHARNQRDSLTGKKSARGHRLSSGIPDRRERHQQRAKPVVLGLGRVAEAIRHVPGERFKAALENAQHLVYKYPLQAMLVGVGVGYFLRGNKRDRDGTASGPQTNGA